MLLISLIDYVDKIGFALQGKERGYDKALQVRSFMQNAPWG